MISVEQATDFILQAPFKPDIVSVKLNQAVGRVLAEPIYADRDFPPFHRVMMDGIALRKSDFDSGQRSFEITGLQAAGAVPLAKLEEGKCVEIMTGASLTPGSDAVIRYEDLKISGETANVVIDSVREAQNIHHQGTDRKKGDLLIASGNRIEIADLGVLATVGKGTVKVYSMPKVAVLSTGDELVDVQDIPEVHQIRKSNVIVLSALCRSLGLDVTARHINDEPENIRSEVETLLEEFDVILMSGGVSKGKKDFIPQVLEELEVTKYFHRVAQRPGKPFWFGQRKRTTVFAFPGNPVSTYVCALRYFVPWLRSSLGLSPHPGEKATLTENFTFKPGLQYFLQVNVSCNKEGRLMATPHPGQGSGDLANLCDADAFMELPAEKTNFEKGAAFPIIYFRHE